MAEQEKIKESSAEVMMADDVMLEILSPNPELKMKEVVLDACEQQDPVIFLT